MSATPVIHGIALEVTRLFLELATHRTEQLGEKALLSQVKKNPKVTLMEEQKTCMENLPEGQPYLQHSTK